MTARIVGAALLASPMMGAIMGRHILRLEPLALQPIEALISDISATLRRYLTAPLAGDVYH